MEGYLLTFQEGSLEGHRRCTAAWFFYYYMVFQLKIYLQE